MNYPISTTLNSRETSLSTNTLRSIHTFGHCSALHQNIKTFGAKLRSTAARACLSLNCVIFDLGKP